MAYPLDLDSIQLPYPKNTCYVLPNGMTLDASPNRYPLVSLEDGIANMVDLSSYPFVVNEPYLDGIDSCNSNLTIFASLALTTPLLGVCGDDSFFYYVFLDEGTNSHVVYRSDGTELISLDATDYSLGLDDGSFIITCGHSYRDIPYLHLLRKKLSTGRYELYPIQKDGGGLEYGIYGEDNNVLDDLLGFESGLYGGFFAVYKSPYFDANNHIYMAIDYVPDGGGYISTQHNIEAMVDSDPSVYATSNYEDYKVLDITLTRLGYIVLLGGFYTDGFLSRINRNLWRFSNDGAPLIEVYVGGSESYNGYSLWFGNSYDESFGEYSRIASVKYVSANDLIYFAVVGSDAYEGSPTHYFKLAYAGTDPFTGVFVQPPLRMRQRDDRFNTPRMGQTGAAPNHPTSRQYSIRRGFKNTYW